MSAVPRAHATAPVRPFAFLCDASTLATPVAVQIVKRLGLAITIASGRNPLLPFLPYRVAMVQVVGKPILSKKTAEPSQAEIDALHAKYVKGLREVFDNNKARLGYPDAELVVV